MNFKIALCAAVFVVCLFGLPQRVSAKLQQSKAAAGQKATSTNEDYNPSEVSDEEIKTLELKVNDQSRDREIPILVYLPAAKKPKAVIIHSHGLGGRKETSSFLGNHWAARGYVCIFLQHPGSDDSIWQGKRLREILPAMKKAASGDNLLLRIGDVTSAIDQLGKWNQDDTHALHGRMDLKHIGMSGHSFGAITTQNVSGQNHFGKNRTDARITAAIPMSPSMPRGGDAKKRFNEVKIPWFCITGTKDNSPIGDITPDSRLEVFKALPNGDKYELVLDDAEHSVFTETKSRRRGPRATARNPNHHVAIKALSTAFWDSYLDENAAAKAWLDDEKSVRGVLQAKDRWLTK